MRHKAPSRRWQALAWLIWFLVLGSGAGLLLTYEGLPQDIPLSRHPLTGRWETWAPKSIWTVLRIPAMGIGQLGAAATMAHSSQRNGSQPWAAFWNTLFAVAGGKTLLEATQIGLLGAGSSHLVEGLFYLGTLAVVVVGIGLACRKLWRHRHAWGTPRLSGTERAALGLSLMTWLTAALALARP
ncbi:MAG: hypothetical protein OXR73_13510 [Myxococcales bacterium]|nr:hypothetical protein [Myxococcales bacterium]